MRSATGQSGTDLDLLDELEERMKRLRIESSSNSPDLVIHGNAFQGYAVNVPGCEGGATVIGTGACCLPDGTCEVVTPGQCLLDGGTFVGGSCDPNPCGLICPDDISGAFHNITFDGITVSCGCVLYELHALESVITTGDPNGTGTVIASGSPPWLTGTLASMHSEYYADTTCSDNFGSADTDTEGFVWCADEGGAWVYLRCGAEGAEALFLARVTAFGTPTSNTLSCGDFVDPIAGFGFGPANAVGTGGTVTIAS